MLLYLTGSEGRTRRIDVPDTLPGTVVQLYQRAMREHIRPAVAEEYRDAQWYNLPDWRFDRRVIQIALFLKERLGVEKATPVGLMGTFSPRWFQTDFALQGLGAIPVGLHQDLTDTDLTSALAGESIRGVVTTDRATAERVLALRAAGVSDLDWVIVPHAGEGDPEVVVDWDFLWDRGRVLDTPERASNWRYHGRKIAPDQTAGIHYEPDLGNGSGSLKPFAFTHAEAIEGVRRHWAQCPAIQGDVAYLDTSAATLRGRLATYAWIGDGVTVTVSHAGMDERGWHGLGVTKLLAEPTWVHTLASAIYGKNSIVRRGKARRIVQQRVGERLRRVWLAAPCATNLVQQLEQAGLPISDVGLNWQRTR